MWRKKQNPRHRHCEPYVQRTYIVYTVPMWFLRLFGVSVGSAQVSRTDTSYVSEFETPRLVGTYWYVRTYKPTTEIQDLPYVRFISTGKFPGLTRKVSGSHSYGILSRKIASPGKVERTPHSQWSTEENKTTRKQKNTTTKQQQQQQQRLR